MSPQEILEAIERFKAANKGIEEVPTTLEVGFDTWRQIKKHPHVLNYANFDHLTQIDRLCGLRVVQVDKPFHFEIK